MTLSSKNGLFKVHFRLEGFIHKRKNNNQRKNRFLPFPGLRFPPDPPPPDQVRVGPVHVCNVTHPLDSHLFRVLLPRRLQLPLPLTARACRCGCSLGALGHHRAACARGGVLGRRGCAVESVAARICREAGGRVATNVFVRDLDLDLHNAGDWKWWRGQCSSGRWVCENRGSAKGWRCVGSCKTSKRAALP